MINKLKKQMKLIMHGPYETDTLEGRANERSRNMALTAITAMLAKAVAMVTPLITVRITLSYLGEETYGLWSTVTTFFALFAYADLGLGSGLQTELSHASALKDKQNCRKLVSTTYAILSIIALILIIIFIICYPIIDWNGIVNAQTPEAKELAGKVVIAILVPKVINIPMALIQRTQNAMQEGYRTNLWQLSGNILSLIFVVTISICDGGKIFMMGASSSIVVIVATLNMLFYFGKQRPELKPSFRLFDWEMGKKLLTTGIAFFVLSIFTSISLSIDNWIVAQTSSLSDVTPYSIMLKLANMVNVVSMMLSTPLWAANGEALERGEISWVRKKTYEVAKLSAILSIAFSLFMIIACKPALWILTDNEVKADFGILVGMCLLNILISVTNPYFMILNSARVIKFQIVNYIVYAIISLPMKFYLGNIYGVKVIPWIGAISYLILLTIPTIFRSHSELKRRMSYENSKS